MKEEKIKDNIKEIDPAIWGPSVWNIINCWLVSGEMKAVNIIILREYLMFCQGCIDNFNSFIERNPIDNIQGTENRIGWFLILHNEVNERDGKELWDLNQYTDYLQTFITN